MPEAIYIQCDDALDITPAAAASAGKVVLTSVGLAGIILAALAAGEQGAVLTEGVVEATSASATVFAEGDDVYWDDTNKLAVTAGTSTATFRLGRAVAAKASGATAVRVVLNVPGTGAQVVSTADSAAVTNTTTETVVGTFTIPANTLKVGNVIEFLAAILAGSTNSTDTFRGRVRLGGVTGTVVADTTAIDLANNDVGVMRGQVVVRAIGASGKIAAASQSIMKTTATPIAVGETALDTTAAVTLVATITESVASASNSAVSPVFTASIR